jgi:hypothetical protein
MIEDALDNIDWAGLGDDLSGLFAHYGLADIGEVMTQIGVGEEHNSFSFITDQDGRWVAL